jgi:hypothetical protein
MSKDETCVDAIWAGPYSWPKYEDKSNLPPVPKHPGIYLQTFDYQDGFILSSAGLTRRPIPTRLHEHTRKYITGDYTILDIGAVQKGIRKEVWHGWGWTSEKRADFEKRKLLIQDATEKMLTGYRVFVTNIGTQPRILERLEAAIILNLYQQPEPFCNIPDRGMMLAPRWEKESPIAINNKCPVRIYGLPSILQI